MNDMLVLSSSVTMYIYVYDEIVHKVSTNRKLFISCQMQSSACCSDDLEVSKIAIGS